ncbi:benzoate/H(+) symporter BenE family transporter [Shewanella surugensis]|uniref:Benzoate/H(+) symporter BenE family transporter n=1 Tax=Shewanella surugensis TaxID=212020 RepID=A0ABT0L6Q5_9GAMM|nr:benzoate/H(+) symporter BenE family transporter [Shewanella surugensis]MCL1123042.1 benzoate/H(+) symporter BenE family transporter [Shewanella surugensis]
MAIKDQLSLALSGAVTVIVAYASSAVIVFNAAHVVGASAAEITSWIWALGLGMGLSTLALSLYYKVPLLTAWSTPGAALLVTSLSGVGLNEAIGGFLLCSLLITLSGALGLMDKMMRFIPKSLASAMLAGVLLKFVLDIFVAAQTHLLLILVMLVLYLLGKYRWPTFNIPVVLISGIGMSYLLGDLSFVALDWHLATPVLIEPKWTYEGLIGVGVPLFIVTMCSQNLPGLAVLQAHDYQVKASPLITTTGITGLCLAPFGGFAFNLAAITAAICMGKEVHPNKNKRYWAAVWAGGFYVVLGLFAATVAQILTLFPSALVMGLAGLALLGTFSTSLQIALADKSLGALFTFVITASGVAILNIGSAFWGILVGLIIYYMLDKKRSNGVNH